MEYYISILPLLILVIAITLLYLKRRWDEARWSPASKDTLLRPPGESLRLKIVELDDIISDCVTSACLAAVMQFGGCLVINQTTNAGTTFQLLIAITAVTVPVTLWYISKAALLVKKRRCYNQGFEGERLAGEQLNFLMLEGYRVFHDLQFDGFNVDHALVGPAGILAIETKTHRKNKKIKSNHVVKFDGKQLHWPDGKVNNWGIRNAFDRAETMRKWLSSALGEPIHVYPVLVFPGWIVETEKLGKVRVLNPKLVGSYLKGLKKSGDVLSETLIKRVAHQLGEKSKLTI